MIWNPLCLPPPRHERFKIFPAALASGSHELDLWAKSNLTLRLFIQEAIITLFDRQWLKENVYTFYGNKVDASMMQAYFHGCMEAKRGRDDGRSQAY